MKHIIPFIMLMALLAVASPVHAGTLTEPEFNRELEKQLADDMNKLFGTFLEQYRPEIEEGLNEVERLLEEIRKPVPKKEKGFHI